MAPFFVYASLFFAQIPTGSALQDRAYRAICPSPTKPNELKRPPHAAYTQ